MERHDRCRPRRRRPTLSTKVIKASGWKNVLGLADVLTIDQETLDLVGQAASAGGYKFTKMADTFGFDQQDFQPILNKMHGADQHPESRTPSSSTSTPSRSR